MNELKPNEQSVLLAVDEGINTTLALREEYPGMGSSSVQMYAGALIKKGLVVKCPIILANGKPPHKGARHTLKVSATGRKTIETITKKIRTS